MKKGTVGVLATMLGVAAGSISTKMMSDKVLEGKEKKVDKFKGYYNVLLQWIQLKQKGISLSKYFVDNGYHSIAIYGMGELGNCLYEELKDTDVKVECAIDKNATSTFSDITVYDPEEELPQVDVIVVTAIFAFEGIEENMKKKTEIPIISLEDVVYEI